MQHIHLCNPPLGGLPESVRRTGTQKLCSHQRGGPGVWQTEAARPCVSTRADTRYVSSHFSMQCPQRTSSHSTLQMCIIMSCEIPIMGNYILNQSILLCFFKYGCLQVTVFIERDPCGQKRSFTT